MELLRSVPRRAFVRYRAGGLPNWRLKARLKAGSESYPTFEAICATLSLVEESISAP